MTDPRSALERLTRWRDTGCVIGRTYACAADLRDDVLALLPLLEWRPISEAPKDGTAIDLWVDRFGGERVPDATWHRGAWCFYGIDGFESWGWVKVTGQVTHWKLPPAAPTEAQP